MRRRPRLDRRDQRLDDAYRSCSAQRGRASRDTLPLRAAESLSASRVFVLLLIAVPVIEVFVLIEVMQAIGWLAALLLFAGPSMLGMRLVRIEGRAAIQRVRLAVAGHGEPAGAALDGALRFLGSVLLAVPGFVTDALGALLLLRPTRALTRRWISRRYAARLMTFVAASRRFAPRSRGRWPADVESTAVEDDLDRLGR